MNKRHYKTTIITKQYFQAHPSANLRSSKKDNFLKGIFSFFFNILFTLCYRIGLNLLRIVSVSARPINKELGNTVKYFSKRKKILRHKQFYSSLAFFGIVCIVIVTAFQSFKFVANGLGLKTKVLGISITGAGHLEQAKSALTQQDYTKAQNEFLVAYQSFLTSQREIQSAGNLANGLLNFLPQKKDGDKLLLAASQISKAGSDLVNFYKIVEGFKLSPSGLVLQGKDIKENLNKAAEILKNISMEVASASNNVASVSSENLPLANRESFESLRQKLKIGEQGISAFSDLFQLFKQIVVGKKNILVLFENNDELRATGGFPGTFGKITLENGEIKNLRINSIYDLDGQLHEKIMPPLPVFNVNDRWYLRDSNWFANFPDSVKKITGFYEKEGEETPDLIIAVTPQVIKDVLNLTGAIDLPAHGLRLDAENFVEYIEFNSSLTSPVFQNNPKQVLADFFPALLQGLSRTENKNFGTFFEILQKNLNSKHIIFYSRDEKIQSVLDKFHWTGTILPTDRDYLSVVTSNLGGTKTDLDIKQSIDLKTSVDTNGILTNELTITRTNSLPKMAGLKNLSFIRVFVPRDSKLVSNSGFDIQNIEAPSTSGYKIDPDVYEWEKNSVKDLTTGTIIGLESNKTFFGNWLSVEGGESKTMKLVYTLPFRLKNLDHHSLLIQKQMGAQNQNFNFVLDFPGYKLEWKSLDEGILETGSFKDQLVLSKDYLLGYVLSKAK